jgi:hypothetical protein
MKTVLAAHGRISISWCVNPRIDPLAPVNPANRYALSEIRSRTPSRSSAWTMLKPFKLVGRLAAGTSPAHHAQQLQRRHTAVFSSGW